MSSCVNRVIESISHSPPLTNTGALRLCIPTALFVMQDPQTRVPSLW